MEYLLIKIDVLFAGYIFDILRYVKTIKYISSFFAPH